MMCRKGRIVLVTGKKQNTFWRRLAEPLGRSPAPPPKNIYMRNYNPINAYVFVNMMQFTKVNIIFPDMLSKINVTVQDSYSKSLILGNGPVYHSIDCREYKG